MFLSSSVNFAQHKTATLHTHQSVYSLLIFCADNCQYVYLFTSCRIHLNMNLPEHRRKHSIPLKFYIRPKNPRFRSPSEKKHNRVGLLENLFFKNIFTWSQDISMVFVQDDVCFRVYNLKSRNYGGTIVIGKVKYRSRGCVWPKMHRQ